VVSDRRIHAMYYSFYLHLTICLVCFRTCCGRQIRWTAVVSSSVLLISADGSLPVKLTSFGRAAGRCSAIRAVVAQQEIGSYTNDKLLAMGDGRWKRARDQRSVLIMEIIAHLHPSAAGRKIRKGTGNKPDSDCPTLACLSSDDATGIAIIGKS
jgi:hypothetical protein